MNLCQFHTGCFGCCGHTFGTKEDVCETIKKNMVEFRAAQSIDSFATRQSGLRSCGICVNIGVIEGKIGCLVHPLRNKNKDLRIGYCDNAYLCETQYSFLSWPDEKQQAFLRFITDRNPDYHEYSIRIDNGSLLLEFETQEAAVMQARLLPKEDKVDHNN